MARYEWPGDVDAAVEHYAGYLERQSDTLARMAEQEGRTPERRQSLIENAAANRAQAAAVRSEEGREYLRRTGLWIQPDREMEQPGPERETAAAHHKADPLSS